jgi:diguanylate cyclase (GGDEF)-like protein
VRLKTAPMPTVEVKQPVRMPSGLAPLFGELVDLLPTGLLLVQKLTADRFLINFASQPFGRFVQQSPAALIGQTIDQLRLFGENTVFKEQLLACATSGVAKHFELCLGSVPHVRHFLCHVTRLAPQPDLQDQVMIIVSDRTAERYAEAQSRLVARQDSLTGLPNRLHFNEQVEACVQVHANDHFPDRRADLHSAVLFLNVDRFQVINESLGHLAGDELLVAIARRLASHIPDGAFLARLSSDEFAIFIRTIESVEDAQFLADTLHQAMGDRFIVSGHEVYSSVSIGIATTFGASRNWDEVVRNADFALHQAKAGGRRCSRIYHPASHKKASTLFKLEAELRRAIAEDKLHLAFQPLVKLSDFSLAGFEALARWDHPELGPISPTDFIPLAEATGLILPLGRWAMLAACTQMSNWQKSFGPSAENLMIGVNLSAVQLARDNMVDVVQNALTVTQLNPRNLKIELTESALVDDPDRTQTVLRDLKKLDIAIALDDFGTGYSSLSYLQRFPIDILKIDRSFVSQMMSSADNQKIVGAIMSLGKSLGMEVVAEGIEKSAEAEHLRKSGCEYGQGYVFSRPLSIEQAEVILAKGPFVLAD